MVILDNLVYLELHKTGGSHVRKVLTQVFGASKAGKHNAITEQHQNHHIAVSVRNPWDWYVSLWAYGCMGKGAIRRRTTARPDLGYYLNEIPAIMKGSGRSVQAMVFEAKYKLSRQHQTDWNGYYQDPDSSQNFQAWLKAVLSPEHAIAIGEGYGLSPLSAHSGLMTFRLLRLTMADPYPLFNTKAFVDQGAVDEYLESNLGQNATFIKMEEMSDGLLLALERSGQQPTSCQRNKLDAMMTIKTNASKRKTTSYYYNTECRDLVADREASLIKNFNYSFPGTTA